MTHIQPGEIIDLHADTDSPMVRSGNLFETDLVRVVRMDIQAGKQIAEHKAPGELIVQCIQGLIEFTSNGKTRRLGSGKMLYLTADELHSVNALEDSSFLLTIAKSK